MTEELKQKAEEYGNGMAVYYESAHGRIPSQLERYLRNAYIAGATENGIKWHDLRKDPNDLPKEKTFVISNMGLLAFYKNGMWFLDVPDNAYYFATKEIIAWCEIPQFKE